MELMKLIQNVLDYDLNICIVLCFVVIFGFYTTGLKVWTISKNIFRPTKDLLFFVIGILLILKRFVAQFNNKPVSSNHERNLCENELKFVLFNEAQVNLRSSFSLILC